MPLGVVQNLGSVKVGDTAEIYASLRVDEQPVSPDQIMQVNFIVQKPDGTLITDIGLIMDDGQGFLRWTDTAEIGGYLVQAQFVLVSGQIRSVLSDFSVTNPFQDNPNPTPTQLITGAVMLRLEDLFDSVEGGPWLRDQTIHHFDENKIAAFIPEALLDINIQMPPTNFDIGLFTAWSATPGDNPNQPLLVKAVLVLMIRHLMRSYVEQPMVQGAQVVWHDRTRYTQLWQSVYQVEYADYIQAVRLWKRTTLDLGRSALSVFSKSGRGGFYGASARSRGAYGRGYY